MFIHISSYQTREFFTSNRPSDFRVKLPYIINLDPSQKYEVALLDISTPPLINGYKTKYVTVNTNICDTSIIKLSLRPILRKIYPACLGTPHEFAAPQYVPMTSHSFDMIDIYLLDDNDGEPSFAEEVLYATLHIRACS